MVLTFCICICKAGKKIAFRKRNLLFLVPTFCILLCTRLFFDFFYASGGRCTSLGPNVSHQRARLPSRALAPETDAILLHRVQRSFQQARVAYGRLLRPVRKDHVAPIHAMWEAKSSELRSQRAAFLRMRDSPCLVEALQLRAYPSGSALS